jgi:long-chain acyl-CoA synthetase
MMVHQFLERSARATPAAIAVVDSQREMSYADLDALANRFANVLLFEGVRRGDRVVLALDNSVELAAAYFGVLKAGGIGVPLPVARRNDRLGKAIADCRPRVCLIDAATAADPLACQDFASSTALVVGSHGPLPACGFRAIEPLLEAAGDSPAGVRGVDVDLALIIYTSGSTGDPRGVMLTHRNIVSNTRSIVQYLRLTNRDRVMCVLPFHYVYGLSLLNTHIAVGGSIVIDNRFAFPNVVLSNMQAHAVTGLAGVPSTFALLLHRSNLETTPLPELRYVTQAGGAMPVSRVVEWLERGPKVPFYVMYGATEASARLTYLDPAQLPNRAGSIGRAIPNVEILIVREDGTRAPAGETGELVARGSNIARGYWNDPAETSARFDVVGYHTGDLGYADEEGFIYLVGRRHDMIKVGANRVGSKEIEEVISEYPGVNEVAVIGTLHDILGEVPVAFISLRDDSAGFDHDAVMAFLRARLPAYKMPDRLIIRSELPKIAGVGKIDKTSLRAQLGAATIP